MSDSLKGAMSAHGAALAICGATIIVAVLERIWADTFASQAAFAWLWVAPVVCGWAAWTGRGAVSSVLAYAVPAMGVLVYDWAVGAYVATDGLFVLAIAWVLTSVLAAVGLAFFGSARRLSSVEKE